MRRGDRGLAYRLGWAMALVVLLASLVSLALTQNVFSSSVAESSRVTLARQADLIAGLPAAAAITNRLDAGSEAQGLFLGVVNPGGRTRGAATSVLKPRQIRRLLSGRAVSTTADLDGDTVQVEARPVARGGAIVLASSSSDSDRFVARYNRRTAAALLLALAIALVAAVLTARYVARPLAALAATARRMGAGERGVVPAAGLPGGRRTREVAEVAEALHQLDVALVGSEERQRRFLLSVSHELRTPLTAVRGYAEALAEGVIPRADVPEVARTMVAESQRLEGYVADLLGLARLEADDFRLRPGPVDLGGLVSSTVGAWAARAEAAGLELTAAPADDAGVVTSDADRLRQVLDALVDNAVRVCPPGARIVLAAAPGRLEVRDSGPGLTEADAAVAFEPGVLHDRYAGERSGGHGLGLAIVHRLVGRLGGTIVVRRAPEGGAAFRIDLPRGSA